MNRKTFFIGAVVIILVLLGAWYFLGGGSSLGRETYSGRIVAFSYPGKYTVQEYGLRSVIVGTDEDGTFVPAVEINQFRRDPESPAPPDYITYINEQAMALCGTDAPGMTVSCTGAHIESFTSEGGVKGEIITLQATATDESGDSFSFTYGPIYTFNQSRAADSDDPALFRSLFIYPSFTTALEKDANINLLDEIMESLEVKDDITDVETNALPEGN